MNLFVESILSFQFVVAIMFIVIGGLNINKSRDHRAAIILNDMILIFIFFITILNVIISGFGLDYSSQPLRLLDAHESSTNNVTKVMIMKQP